MGATTMIAAAQQAASGTIEVSVDFYYLLSALFALIGALLARKVTIRNQNKKLGRRQTVDETWPLTMIAILIVCPIIWHFQVAIPWAALSGLGVGYVVETILTILGRGAITAARAAVREAAAAMDENETPHPDTKTGVAEALHQTYPVAPELPGDMRKTLETDMDGLPGVE